MKLKSSTLLLVGLVFFEYVLHSQKIKSYEEAQYAEIYGNALTETVHKIIELQNQNSVSPNTNDSIALLQHKLSGIIQHLSSSSSASDHKKALWGQCYMDLFELRNYFYAALLDFDPGFFLRAEELIRSALEQDNKEILGKVYHYQALYYSNVLRDYKSSIINCNQSIRYSTEARDTYTLAASYNGLALNYDELNFPDKAIEYYNKALELNPDVFQLNSTYINIGDMYLQQNMYDKALEYIIKADSVSRVNDFPASFHVNICLNYVNFYIKKKDYKKAEEFILKAESYQEEMFRGRILYFQGNIHFNKGDFIMAIQSFEDALSYNRQKGFSNQYLRLFNSIGQSYINLNSIAGSGSDQYLLYAKQAFNESLKLITGSQNLQHHLTVYTGLKTIALKEKKYKLAYEMLELERNILDSINNFESKARFIEYDIRSEFEKQRTIDSFYFEEKELQSQLEVVRKKNENRVLYMSLGMLILSVIVVFNRFKSQDSKKKILIANQNALIVNQEKEMIESELNLLKLQINPHFLFNAINSVYFKISKEDKDAKDTLLGFSDILRYQLYECSQPSVSIEKEIQCIQEYTKLQLLRTEDLILDLKVDASAAHFSIAPLLLIPFIENAFKYLPQTTQLERRLYIHLKKESGLFVFKIINTFDPNRIGYNLPGKFNGIGIENVKRRLELLYSGRHTLMISQDNSLFIVQLNIRLDEK